MKGPLQLIDHVHSAATGGRQWQEVPRNLPHLQRKPRPRQRLGADQIATDTWLEAVAKCQTAAFIVSGDGEVLVANSEGSELLEDGTAIRLWQGRMCAKQDTEAAQLLSLIRAASRAARAVSQQDAVMLIHRRDASAVSVLVAPHRGSVIVFVRDPTKASVAHEPLQALYGLTPAEAHIAEALSCGNSIEMIAAEQRLSRETVRKQVKAVLAKTGTHRQAECVSMILRSVASMNYK